MGIKFITKGEWISKHADTLLWLGSICTIFGLCLFLTDGGWIIGLVLVIAGISCIIGRIAFVVQQAKHINKANLDKIMLLCKCSKEDAELIYRYVQQAKRSGELYRASEEKKIVPILCQSTPYELHEKIPCMKLSDIFKSNHETTKVENRTYTCAEVAKFCGVSVSTIRKWIHDGLIKATKYANMYVISQDDLLTYARQFDPQLEQRIREE